MFNHYIAPLTFSLKGNVEARQRKPSSSHLSQWSATIRCLLHKIAFKKFRYQESWQQFPTHNRELQENRWYFFCHSKGKTKREVSTLSYRDWCAAGGHRAGLSLSNHCTLSRPLRRVRGSLWLQDNFPHQDLVNHTNWVWQFCDGDCSTLPQTLFWSRQDSKSSFQNYFLNHIAVSSYNGHNSDHFLPRERCQKTTSYEVILQ